MRIPNYIYALFLKLSRTRTQLTQELGQEPTEQAIAERMNISLQKLYEIERCQQNTVSLNEPFGEKNDMCLGDIIEDSAAASFEEVSQQLMKEQFQSVLSILSPREYPVLDLRCGLHDSQSRTLEAVGKILGVTRERVRQIEAKALEKLKGCDRIREQLTE